MAWPLFFFVLMVASSFVGFAGDNGLPMWIGRSCFVVNGIMFFLTAALSMANRKGGDV